MAEYYIIQSVEFKMKTQAMLNFAPMIFTIKQPRRRDLKLEVAEFWGEASHKLLGPNFQVSVDQDGNLRSIRIVQFLKEYARIQQAFETDSQIILDRFTVLQEGLMRVSFPDIMKLAYNKYAINAKMRSRSSI